MIGDVAAIFGCLMGIKARPREFGFHQLLVGRLKWGVARHSPDIVLHFCKQFESGKVVVSSVK